MTDELRLTEDTNPWAHMFRDDVRFLATLEQGADLAAQVEVSGLRASYW